MTQEKLPLELPDPQPKAVVPPALPHTVRVSRPVRNQVKYYERDLDSFVAEDHPVRAIWELLEKLDLAAFSAQIKATLQRPGHPAIDPVLLLALWVWATAEGIGSARRLAGLCVSHDAYRWLCGEVSVNYHTLATFRTAHLEELDQLLTQIVAMLLAAEVVKLKGVAQDGMRVRASAGSGSFHRQQHLADCLRQAREQVDRLAQERERPDPQTSAREQKARQRAQVERSQRLEEALRQIPELQAAKDRQQRTLAKPKRGKIGEARASSTDPEARVMKMPDGGWRPAYNLEVATDVASGIVVGVEVTNQSSDARQATPMEEQVVRRTGVHPQDYLMDGGFAQREEITTLTERGITVYAPTRPPRTETSGRRQEEARPDDPPAVIAWRERMGTAAAQAVYRQRAATAEWVNAQLRQHGPPRLTLRGLPKVRALALLLVITHNLLRWTALGG